MALSSTTPEYLPGNEPEQLHYLNDIENLVPFERRIKETGLFPLTADDISVLQVNVGKVCNLSCKHCHVNAGPNRTESMSRETMTRCLDVLAGNTGITTLDITGGAPELNPHLPWFIEQAAGMGRKVMLRTNLTVLEQEQTAYLAEYYAAQRVEIIASLPYYQGKTADRQRGQGVFEASIRVLKHLNELGYGQAGSPLQLNLAYNPGGAFLPPDQQAIEADYHRELADRYGVVFNRLYTLTNMPLGRFLVFLQQSGNSDRYLERLAGAYNPVAVTRVMCRNMISVGWDGRLYDCDFNQALGLLCAPDVPGHIDDFDLEALQNRRIVVANHCYACTAGAGSSCGGAIAG
ncbi:Antilisterial bacteriocin subtilosin biosynthesis protein AlbA [Sporotomaculum syntrophicum]|uniref:Antilisterial bacteriocin subtilosin biosynthesis protein AlbA n=1 Tax=Sporotomaculum syntrophicum TaxID=182264 RepID=A0A9D2WQE1_9FIRM|nr:arsenosugar biosynthesis radical SAM (seleno)protein ArsS [Sporotomaculum syntrophicum]KAF1085524.1 Antilisterial bacteriocin subtilosin biosynthesis protein AlbA [Sporotomaculum syntrophicum]